MLDLSAPGVSAKIADEIKEAIDKYAQDKYDDGHRNHLGASLIGHECSRYLWYVFRWALHQKFSGRMQRLFRRGHLEEDRYTEYLEAIGIELWTHDPETKEQFRVSGCGGHFGGSLDGLALIRGLYDYDKQVLVEFKTNGTGAGFQKLFKDKLNVAKPQHFAQTSVYGNKKKIDYVLYLNTCKNDDDMYVELAKLDHSFGQRMEERAERIILSQTPPVRCSDSPTYWQCKVCPMIDICHAGAPPEKNCRSCKFAKPVDNAEWLCSEPNVNSVIPKDFIPKGCGNHKAVTANVT